MRLESTRTAIRLQVRDDGKGFSASSVLASGTSRSFGLFGMRERVRDLGGQLEVKSQPGEGTCVQAEVPLAVEEHPKEEMDARAADG
ncbi:sensor histidine kinase [Pyxidicoccus sp. 3LG]